jgi:two-component system, chemotaxis family, sensor kinase CheA
MESLNSVFSVEANETLADLERALLHLEKDPDNGESISSVFRAMHTLKGSAGMFGFESISSFTHHLESIYEAIRDGERKLTQEILSITLDSLDHLKNLVANSSLKGKEIKAKHEALINEHKRICSDHTTVTDPPGSPGATAVNTYYILFNPVSEILRKGTNTLYLIDDLLSMGDGICFPFFNIMPSLSELKPDDSYTSFEVILATNKSENEIKDVFMFVDGECELVISKIGDGNLLEGNDARKQLKANHIVHSRMGEPAVRLSLVPPSEQTKDLLISAEAQQTKAVSNVRVSSDRLDELMNLVSELVTTQASLSLYSEKAQLAGLSSISENVGKITRRLRDNAFTMSLIPIQSLVVRFQRLVRDLSKDLDKAIDFKTEGTETEIDKSIVEKLTDPLLHLLRNSLDHGIETPDERERKGKPRKGTLLLKSFYSGSNVIIEISDDGAGINLEKVRNKAIGKGLIAADAVMSESELTNLIFMPGFSTAEQVTGVSGRGVGMDVVRRNITDIRGEIEIRTQQNKGTTFSIRLPLTLSIIDGLLVRIGQTDFILPLSSVNKCYEVETRTLEDTFNHWTTLEGQRTPFIFLRKELGINHDAPLLSQIIKIAHQGQYVGLAVDKIIGEYQAVLKPLGELYHDQDEYSGATILGDGSVALVMDPYKIVKKLVSQVALTSTN